MSAERGLLPRELHPWKVSFEEAVAIQARLRARIVRRAPKRAPRLVAGCDVSYSRKTHLMHAAVVVVDAGEAALPTVAEATWTGKASFPYIPGLFSFREVPPLLKAFAKLRARPDLLLLDGHGESHPRRCGLACHVGVLFDLPAIGCAKKRLYGEVGEPADERGAIAELRAPDDGAVLGAAVRTRAGVKPVFVSIGHRIDLPDAIEQTLRLSPRFRLPEPARRAHHRTRELQLASDAKAAAPVKEHGYAGFRKRTAKKR